MHNLHIKREHKLGLEQARKITANWIDSAQKDYRMVCTLERTEHEDIVTFKRSGIAGVVISNACKFEIKAKLGFLFKSFLPVIKQQIEKNLDKAIGNG